MSHNYSFEIETSATPKEVLENTLKDTTITAVTPRQSQTTEYPAIITMCIDPDERLVATLEIQSSIRVNMALTGRYDQIDPKLVEMIVNWLSNNEGDAALTLDGEYLLLYRKNGKIFLNSVENSWYGTLSHSLDATDIPFTLKASCGF